MTLHLPTSDTTYQSDITSRALPSSEFYTLLKSDRFVILVRMHGRLHVYLFSHTPETEVQYCSKVFVTCFSEELAKPLKVVCGWMTSDT